MADLEPLTQVTVCQQSPEKSTLVAQRIKLEQNMAEGKPTTDSSDHRHVSMAESSKILPRRTFIDLGELEADRVKGHTLTSDLTGRPDFVVSGEEELSEMTSGCSVRKDRPRDGFIHHQRATERTDMREEAPPLAGCPVVIDSPLLQQWRRTGHDQGLTSDSKIAAFLLSRYEESRTPAAQSSPLCASCQTPLTLVCLTCNPAQARYEEDALPPATVCGDDDGGDGPHHGSDDSDNEAPSAVNSSDGQFLLTEPLSTDDRLLREKSAVGVAAGLVACTRAAGGTSKESGESISWSKKIDEKISQCYVKIADIGPVRSVKMLQQKKGLLTAVKAGKPKHPKSGNHRSAVQHYKRKAEKNKVNATRVRKQTESRPQDDEPMEETSTVKILLENGATEEEKTFKCSVCSEAFKDHSSCRTHDQQHPVEDRKLFKCEQCPATDRKLLNCEHVEDRKAFNCEQRPSTDRKLFNCEQGHVEDRKLFNCEQCPATDRKLFNCEQRHVEDRKLFDCEQRPSTDRKLFNCEQRHVEDRKLFDCEQHPSMDRKLFNCEQHPTTDRKLFDCEQRPSTDRKLFRCEHCSTTFHSRGNLVAHCRKHTGERPFCCEVCGKAFARSTTLDQHRRVHSDVRPYKCEECGEAFRQRGMVIVHRRKVHTLERPFSCSVCGASFVVKGHLQVHMQSHAEHRPYLCEECGACFKHKGILETHRMIHTGVRPFPCDICLKAFYRQVDMRAHRKSHFDVRDVVCTVCGAGFGTNGRLKRHMQRHSGLKPFPCSECGKSFVSRSELKVHWRIHSGDKPYVCDVCSRRFQTMGNMKKHRGNRHKHAPSYAPSAAGTGGPRHEDHDDEKVVVLPSGPKSDPIQSSLESQN